MGGGSDIGRPTTESERGANIAVVAPTSSLGRQGQTTTDLSGDFGYNANGINDGTVLPRWRNYANSDFTNDFGMTSGAAPIVAGVAALMLQANPSLGWRDVKEILIRTARRVWPQSREWARNGAGIWFHHDLGAGMVNAAAAVDWASTWTNLPAPVTAELEWSSGPVAIPDLRPTGVTIPFDFSSVPPGPLRVEHVEFFVTVAHPRRGQLRFILTSPSGMRSVVEPRLRDVSSDYDNWRFSSARHWGESSAGIWRLNVADLGKRFAGSLVSARVVLHGTPVP